METLKLVVKLLLHSIHPKILSTRHGKLTFRLALSFNILRSRKHLCPCPICFTHGDMSPVPVTFWLQSSSVSSLSTFCQLYDPNWTDGMEVILIQILNSPIFWARLYLPSAIRKLFGFGEVSFLANKLRHFFDGKVTLKSSILICFQYNWTEWYFSSHCLWMAALLLTILRRRHEARGIIDEAVSDHLTSNMKYLLPISDLLCLRRSNTSALALTPITVINNQPRTEQSRALN